MGNRPAIFSKVQLMKNNNSPNHFIVNTLIDFFQERAFDYQIEMVFICGSNANGIPRTDSDIDLGIVFSETIVDHSMLHEYITELSATLSQVLNKEVDIFVITPDFSHPMLFYNAIISGIPAFINSPAKFLRLKLDAIHQMEDFNIFGVKWQRIIAANLLGGF